MRHLCTSIHPSIESIKGKSIFTRKASRAIVLQDRKILLLFTKRYEDYSLPGGGLDGGEDLVVGMTRELREETGARNVSDVKEFGIYEEYRPWYKDDYDIQHIISYCYICSVDKNLGKAELEDYEEKNGMKALWVDIDEAIKHNQKTIAESKKKGMSITRETYLLKLIKKELL